MATSCNTSILVSDKYSHKSCQITKGSKFDRWSMCFRHEYPQWKSKDPQEHLQLVNSDKDALDLLAQMLQYDPLKRISVNFDLLSGFKNFNSFYSTKFYSCFSAGQGCVGTPILHSACVVQHGETWIASELQEQTIDIEPIVVKLTMLD